MYENFFSFRRGLFQLGLNSMILFLIVFFSSFFWCLPFCLSYIPPPCVCLCYPSVCRRCEKQKSASSIFLRHSLFYFMWLTGSLTKPWHFGSRRLSGQWALDTLLSLLPITVLTGGGPLHLVFTSLRDPNLCSHGILISTIPIESPSLDYTILFIVYNHE